jgi:hypothetical protein
MMGNTVKGISWRAPARLPSIVWITMCMLTGCGWIARQATITYIAVDSKFNPKHVKISVHKSFVERYRNRVSIRADFSVDKAMGAPLPASIDGDLHFAGRAPQVALPLVGEIANAAEQKAAVDLVHGAEGTGKPLEITGVWRIWPEHAAKDKEEQGAPIRPLDSDTPDHVFEIHPITRINGVSTLGSFTPVDGFTPGGADRTFEIWQKASCTIAVDSNTVSIVTETGLYNDAEFIMEIIEPQHSVKDGRFVIASARDMDGKLLVERLRMVFAKGTPPERAVRRLKKGDRLHVYGIPRMDFAEVWRRLEEEPRRQADVSQSLPYEIAILGVYPK